ncbi:radical SAM protein [Candidatus Roizmanbacteria bacterium]|nr:radical SAM protein [Candidatus Roizmanbacteria bacterium]
MKKVTDSITIANKAKNLGLLSDLAGGIQFDINVAEKNINQTHFIDGMFCDHNCRLLTNGQKTGNYECPAARTSNPSVTMLTLVPFEKIMIGIHRAAKGLYDLNKRLIANGDIDRYSTQFCIPDTIKEYIKTTLSAGKIEVNLFGGNPELHPRINSLISRLVADGFMVNLTTTGGRFMRDEKFLQGILEAPPTHLADSADDFDSISYLRLLNDMSLEELAEKIRTIPVIFGQKRKACEAIYTAKLSQKYTGSFPTMLFNLVVHRGNISFIEDQITELRKIFPHILINPYPAQTSFWGNNVEFLPEDLPLLESFIDNRIAEHYVQNDPKKVSRVSNDRVLIQRLHYFLLLKSVFITYQDDLQLILKRISGFETWRCYKTPFAGRYVQIGASKKEKVRGKDKAGGHLGCLWNADTVTYKDSQVWDMNGAQIAKYLQQEKYRLTTQAKNPCAGCIMPRLVFDEMTMLGGIDEKLVENYLTLRKSYVGY